MLKNTYSQQFQVEDGSQGNWANKSDYIQNQNDSNNYNADKSLDNFIDPSIDATTTYSRREDIEKNEEYKILTADMYRQMYPNYDLFLSETLNQERAFGISDPKNPIFFRDFVEFFVRACIVRYKKLKSVG